MGQVGASVSAPVHISAPRSTNGFVAGRAVIAVGTLVYVLLEGAEARAETERDGDR